MRKFLFIFLACALAAAFLGLCRPWNWPLYYRLSSRGSIAPGRITAIDPASKTVYYSFGPDGASGKGTLWNGADGFKAISVGDSIPVFYLPTDPSVSLPGDPKDYLRRQNQILSWLLLGAAVLAWAAFSGEFARLSRRSSK